MSEIAENSPNQIADFNPTVRDFPDQVTLQELFEAQVRHRRHQSAVLCDHDPVWGASTLSYEQLNEKANQVAHRLRDEGVQPRDIVGILMERSFAIVVGIYGV